MQPTGSFDIVNVGPAGMVTGTCPLSRSDIWINGGFFAMRNEILRYIRPGDDLLSGPFQRLIEKRALLAYKYTGFWQCMDTFKDKQRLEELNHSTAPWKVWHQSATTLAEAAKCDASGRMMHLNLDQAATGELQILCLGSHSDDIEIGCGGTILRLAEQYPGCALPLGGVQRRWRPCSRGATRGCAVRRPRRIRGPLLKTFPDGFLPFVGRPR